MGLTAEKKLPRLPLERALKGLDLNRINSLACLGLPQRVPCNDHARGSISSENTESKKDSSLVKEERILHGSQGLVAAGKRTLSSVNSTEARKRKADRDAGWFQDDPPAKQAIGRPCPSTRSNLDVSNDQRHKKAINAAKELLDIQNKENINVSYDHCRRESTKQGSDGNVEKRRLQVSTSLQNGASNRKIGSLLVKQCAKPRVSARDILVPQSSLLSHIDTFIEENAQQVRSSASIEASQARSPMSCQQADHQNEMLISTDSMSISPPSRLVALRSRYTAAASTALTNIEAPSVLNEFAPPSVPGKAELSHLVQSNENVQGFSILGAQQCANGIEGGASAVGPVMSIPPVTACSITIRGASAPLATLYTDENVQNSSLQSKRSPKKIGSVLAHGLMKPPQQSSSSPVVKEQASGAVRQEKSSPVKAALVENGVIKAGQEKALSISDVGDGKLIHMPEKKSIEAGNTSVQTKKQGETEHFVYVNGRRYQKLKKIGRGGSSEVYKVIDRDGDIYALKRIKLRGRDYVTASGFYQEIELLSRLKGKSYIIRLIDHEVTDKQLFCNDKEGSHIIRHDANIYMLLEYGEVDLATMLQDKLKERSQGDNEVDETWLRFYWQQIVEAVNTVHEERIMHADLKPANFLLVKGVLKLIDFGIAKSIQNDTTNIERDAQVGTLNYMSPEAFLMNEKDEQGNVIKCNRSSDIWALGCILYQMVYGRTPFAHITALHAKIQEVANPHHKINYMPVSNPHLLDIMKKCLAYKREERLRIPELMNHPFLQPHLAQPVYSKKVEEEILLQIQEENKQGRDAAALIKLLEKVRLLEMANTFD